MKFILTMLIVVVLLSSCTSEIPTQKSEFNTNVPLPKTITSPTEASAKTPNNKDDNIQNLQQTSTTPKSIIEMLPKREDIPTEFKMDPPYNMTLREIPEGFDSAVRIEATKIVGSAGLIKLNFNIIRFDSEENARKYHVDDTGRIKNEGGYTEIDIEVPSKAQCFSFTEDYGYEGRFATSDCLKGNLAYQVAVTAAYTFEKPQKYIKDMIALLDNRINK